VEDTQDAPVPVWVRHRFLLVFTCKNHKVGMCPRIKGVLVPQHILGSIIYAHYLVCIEALPYDGNIVKVLHGELCLISIVRYLQ
jgi:hypothetical protein